MNKGNEANPSSGKALELLKTSEIESTHTPGPWGIGEGGFHVYYVNPRIEAGEDIEDERHDSIVATTDGMGAFSGISDDERQANARLIAAAPAMYEALKEVVNSGVEFDDERVSYVVIQVDRLTLSEAIAALALATNQAGRSASGD